MVKACFTISDWASKEPIEERRETETEKSGAHLRQAFRPSQGWKREVTLIQIDLGVELPYMGNSSSIWNQHPPEPSFGAQRTKWSWRDKEQ
ncbi:hypothetical protein FRC03_002293 [Tulasnella sp. 419]|nr:hypothetical protein FRC03_002293 [Tulasnella sp. 419]